MEQTRIKSNKAGEQKLRAIIIFAIVSVVASLIKASNKKDTNEQRAKTKPFVSPPFTSHRKDNNRTFDSKPSKIRKKSHEVIELEDNNQADGLNFGQKINPYYSEEYGTSSKDKEFLSNDEEVSIGLNELQKAVIMAEVLGKPKALRK